MTKDLIIELLYKTIKGPYQLLFKKSKAWEITKTDLLHYPQESIGFHLGCFLLQYKFEIQPRLEEHDVYHVLTNTGVSVKDEIDMQFYLLGNGKYSPFVFIVIGTGLLFYPFQLKSFTQSYKKGKQAHEFHHLDFYKLLPISIKEFQKTFNIN